MNKLQFAPLCITLHKFHPKTGESADVLTAQHLHAVDTNEALEELHFRRTYGAEFFWRELLDGTFIKVELKPYLIAAECTGETVTLRREHPS